MHAFAFFCKGAADVNQVSCVYTMDIRSRGRLCEEIGLYSEVLALDSIELIPKVDQGKVTKGLVVKLSSFRRILPGISFMHG